MDKKSDVSGEVSFKRKRGFRIMGLRLNTNGAVKGFFGGNAYLAILFLLFICIFLFKSAIGFIPGYRTELSEARSSGIEASNHLYYQLVGYDALYTKINQAFIHERRSRFGDLETIVPIYEEFESIIDDQLEDQVDEYTELDAGAEKDAVKITLQKAVATACASLSNEELLKTIQLRIPTTEKISAEAHAKAIQYAQMYALNDYETPDEVNQIPASINQQMGSFQKAVETIKQSDDNLRAMHATVEKNALNTYTSI